MNLRIAMATGGLPFHGHTIKERALGGSETAFLSIAKELVKQGCSVSAFCVCDKPDTYDGVQYYDISQAEEQILSGAFDVVISSRWPEMMRFPGYAGLRVLWCHDILVDVNRFMGGLYGADLVMVLSEYHKKDYQSKVPEFDSFSWVTKNGIDMDLIPQGIEKDPNTIIYTSRPERGLDFLLREMMPYLITKNPDIRLKFANYDLQGMQVDPQTKQKIEEAYILAKRLGKYVIDLGNLSKPDLYREISKSQLLVYPTNFPEISCLTALEAQACGTPVISTQDFALPETVENGYSGVLFEPTENIDEYIQKMCDTTLHLLATPDELTKLQQQARKSVVDRGYSWESIAHSWINKFRTMMRDRSDPIKVGRELVRRGDIIPATLISKAPEFQEALIRFQNREVGFKTSQEAVDYAKSQEMRKSVLAQLASLQMKSGAFPSKPKIRVLDYLCDHSAYGMWFLQQFAQDFEHIELELIPSSPENGEILNKVVTNCKLQDCVHVVAATDESYDIIILSDILSVSTHPIELLNTLRKNLNPNGMFLITTPFGAEKATYGRAVESPTKCWNFTNSDWKEMFNDLGTRFLSSFVPESIGEGGDALGHWCVAIVPQKDSFHRPSLGRKHYATPPYQSLSLCMITGEAQKDIRGALESVANLVDEMIVVDTRPEDSDDASIEIAEGFGATIRRAEFDNFSQVRNISIQDLKTDWFLWMDTDERLVGGYALRKYLVGSVYEGFAVKQVHLTVDELNRSYDMPIRVVRNRPHYKFTGLVHEHCENVKDKPYDDPISPRLLLPDVSIAHFGYLDENIRRQKCSNRNMALLQRDIEESKGRKLTWVLVIRDYLNMCKWHTNKLGSRTINKITRGSREHKYIEAAIATFQSKFPDPKERYYALAFPMYQEALQALAVSGIPYKDSKHLPFQASIMIACGIGGLQHDPRKYQPEGVWFLDRDEFDLRLKRKTAEALISMEFATEEEFAELLQVSKEAAIYGDSHAAELLGAGINVIPKV